METAEQLALKSSMMSRSDDLDVYFKQAERKRRHPKHFTYFSFRPFWSTLRSLTISAKVSESTVPLVERKKQRWKVTFPKQSLIKHGGIWQYYQQYDPSSRLFFHADSMLDLLNVCVSSTFMMTLLLRTIPIRVMMIDYLEDGLWSNQNMLTTIPP